MNASARDDHHHHDTSLPAGAVSVRRRALVLAAIGGVLCVVAWFVSPLRFLQSYLVAFLFWTGISTACLAIVMLHQLVGGIWGYTVRRPAEAGAMTVPLMALLFVPIALGVRYLYPWANPSHAAEPLVRAKIDYLNVGFFLVRAVIYFVLWSGLAVLLNRLTTAQDRVEDPSIAGRLQALSGPGLVLYFLSVTFAMIDWGMSLEPEWYSSMYGPMLLIGHVLSALAVLVLASTWLYRNGRMVELATPQGFHDLGNLLLAFVMLWAYLSFSQYLITWSGNLAEEVPWYLRRSAGGWRAIAASLIVFHFFVPFFLLLSRDRKRHAPALAGVASALLVMRLVDVAWLILPAFGPANLAMFWPVLPSMLGVGGLWVAVFLARLGSRPLVPLHDPALAAVLEHHGD